MKKEDLRKQYFDDISRIRTYDSLTDEEIEKYFDIILSFLPNNGVLYKYKSLTSFKQTYDSLKNGYLYMPTVTQLNDRIDTTFLYKGNVSDDDVKNYYRRNIYKVYKYYVFSDEDILSSVDLPYVEALDMLANESNQLEISSFLKQKYKTSFIRANEYVNQIKRDAENHVIKQLEDENIKYFHNLGSLFQKEYRIFSMSEVYNQDSMWAYYCGNNEGICIGYDFKKAKELPTKEKRRFLNISKVIYTNNKDDFNIFDMYDIVYGINKDDVFFFETNKKLSTNLISKKKSWSQEREWRIITNDGIEKVYIDLVSKIIIDESILEDTRTKRIISLAKKKRWKIIVRKLDLDKCDYVYYHLS